jgi:hypothetical protein
MQEFILVYDTGEYDCTTEVERFEKEQEMVARINEIHLTNEVYHIYFCGQMVMEFDIVAKERITELKLVSKR